MAIAELEVRAAGVVAVMISVPFTLTLNPVGLREVVLVKVMVPAALTAVTALVPPDGPVLVVAVIFARVKPPLQAETPTGAATEQVSEVVGEPALVHDTE